MPRKTKQVHVNRFDKERERDLSQSPNSIQNPQSLSPRTRETFNSQVDDNIEEIKEVSKQSQIILEHEKELQLDHPSKLEQILSRF